tara:strand:- start:61 stop:483 length:423 start_codon:yes stop_codon:yes gene_type:complete
MALARSSELNSVVEIVLGEDSLRTIDNFYVVLSSLDYQMRLANWSARYDSQRERSPKHHAKKLLSEVLLELISNGKIQDDYVIAVEVDPSESNQLENFYKSLSFTRYGIAHTKDFVFMATRVKFLLDNLSEYQLPGHIHC